MSRDIFIFPPRDCMGFLLSTRGYKRAFQNPPLIFSTTPTTPTISFSFFFPFLSLPENKRGGKMGSILKEDDPKKIVFGVLNEFEKGGKVWSALQRKGTQEFVKYLAALSSLATSISMQEKQQPTKKRKEEEEEEEQNPFARANTHFQEIDTLIEEMGEVVGGLWSSREVLLDSYQSIPETKEGSSCLSLQNFVKGMEEGMRKIATFYENELQRKEQILSSIDVSSLTDDDFIRLQMDWESEACLDKSEIRLFFITYRSFLTSLP